MKKYIQDMVAMEGRGKLTEEVIIGYIADGIPDRREEGHVVQSVEYSGIKGSSGDVRK